MQAVTLAQEERHRESLHLLESLRPLALQVGRFEPVAYYDHLNSYSLELAMSGRFGEAEHLSHIVLVSPASPFIPGAMSTPNEIAELRNKRKPGTVPVAVPPVLSQTSSLIHLNDITQWQERKRQREQDDLAWKMASCFAKIAQMESTQVDQIARLFEFLPDLQNLEMEALLHLLIEVFQMGRRQRRRLFTIIKAYLRSTVSDTQRDLAKGMVTISMDETIETGITEMVAHARAKHKKKRLKLWKQDAG